METGLTAVETVAGQDDGEQYRNGDHESVWRRLMRERWACALVIKEKHAIRIAQDRRRSNRNAGSRAGGSGQMDHEMRDEGQKTRDGDGESECSGVMDEVEGTGVGEGACLYDDGYDGITRRTRKKNVLQLAIAACAFLLTDTLFDSSTSIFRILGQKLGTLRSAHFLKVDLGPRGWFDGSGHTDESFFILLLN